MDTRERLIEVAADLLQRRGYTGTGVAQVLADGEATKSSLYFHFPGGKEELAAVALQRRGEAMAGFIADVFAKAPDAATAVVVFAQALADRLTDSDYERGCALATATLETASISELLREACADGYRSWNDLLVEALTAEGWTPQDAGDEAVLILSALEGALVLARAQQDAAPLATVGRQLAIRLRQNQ